MMTMTTIERKHGNTSIGLPGINGERGQRSRTFFYGNIDWTNESSIRFSTQDSPEEFKTAILTEGFVPEEYDYIFYTDIDYNIIYVITHVDLEDNIYYCEAREIDRMELEESEQISSETATFMVNVVKINQGFVSRNSRNMNVTYKEDSDSYNCFPETKNSQYGNLFSFTVVVPPNSSYTFKSDTKITLEFNTLQSSIMDSTINSKFYNSLNGYRGHIEKYSLYTVIYGESGGADDKAGDQGQGSVQNQIINNNICFDDERLENFILTIKDFESESNGSKYLATDIPLMTDPLKRYGANPKAYLCIYTKYDNNFVRKSILGEFPLDFLEDNWNQENVQQTEIQQNQVTAS